MATSYLLFIDESGGHDMEKIDPNWPVFVLVGLLVGETYYVKTLVPRVKELKRKYGLEKDVVLHSRAIRRREDAFSFLHDNNQRHSFLADISELILSLRMRIYGVVLDKRLLRSHFVYEDPYDVSLNQLLSIVCGPPGIPSVNRPMVSRIIAESRGRVEDRDLQSEYQQFKVRGLWSYGSPLVQRRRPRTVHRVFPDRVDFVRKRLAVAGLELADLVAYPIGRAAVNQDWDYPPYQVVRRKLKDLILFPK